MPVTWSVLPGRPRAELVLVDPYTFTEWEDGMLAILDAFAVSEDLRLLIDRRDAARPTSTFVLHGELLSRPRSTPGRDARRHTGER